jgi:hypothetical protein
LVAQAWPALSASDSVVLAYPSTTENEQLAVRMELLRNAGAHVIAAIADASSFGFRGRRADAASLVAAAGRAGVAACRIHSEEDLESCLRSLANAAV